MWAAQRGVGVVVVRGAYCQLWGKKGGAVTTPDFQERQRELWLARQRDRQNFASHWCEDDDTVPLKGDANRETAVPSGKCPVCGCLSCNKWMCKVILKERPKGSATMPLEPIIGKSETVPAEYEAPPTMAEYKALVESIRATLDEHYAQRVKHWAYAAAGVGVGIVLGILLGELIF